MKDGRSGGTNNKAEPGASFGRDGSSRDHAVLAAGGKSPDDIISVIKQSGATLRPAEQRVADIVLADVNFAVHSSNGELARRAGVSEPTVTRFSRAVGCGGVRELKVKLAQSMVVGRIYLEPPPHVGSAQAKPTLWRSVFEEIRRAITAVEQQLRQEDVEKAAEAIADCCKLVAFGVGGGSTVAVTEVTHRFFRLGIAVSRLFRSAPDAHDRGDAWKERRGAGGFDNRTRRRGHRRGDDRQAIWGA